MTINLKQLRAEGFLYAAVFLLALVVRMLSLGSLPLSDTEAALALIAHDASQGAAPLLAPQPAYLSLTTALMFVFSASEWTARFWPALAGSLLVLIPLLFRSYLGRLPALLLAIFLAFDPLLWGISRQAGSLPLALLFVLLALGFWLNGRQVLAGISAGLALLSGPAVWPGVFGLLAALWISGKLSRRFASGGTDTVPQAPAQSTADWRLSGVAMLVTLFTIGTLFFTLPAGMSAVTGSFTARLSGWSQPSGFSAVLLLLALVLYEFFPLVFGLWGAVAGWLRRDSIDRFLFIWWIFALIPAVIYPARTVADLAWSILPLWGLAARQLSRLLVLPRFDRIPVIGLSVLSAVILAFASMTLVAVFNNVGVSTQETVLRLAGAGLMLVASLLLVAWGWNRGVAWRGLVFGFTIVLSIYMLSTGWHAAGLTSQTGRELLGFGSPPKSADLLQKTINDLNRWGPRENNGLDLVVLEEAQRPSLRWLLRDYRRVSFVNALPEESSPALVITTPLPELALSATYRGQSLIYSENVDWNVLLPVDWVRWMVFRSIAGPQRVENRVILWARLDLFPGGLLEAQPGDNPTPSEIPVPVDETGQ